MSKVAGSLVEPQLDGDSDLDAAAVVSGPSQDSRQLAWFENVNENLAGFGAFGYERSYWRIVWGIERKSLPSELRLANTAGFHAAGADAENVIEPWHERVLISMSKGKKAAVTAAKPKPRFLVPGNRRNRLAIDRYQKE